MIEVDVALVPAAVPLRDPDVLIVVDQIRASTTVTTLFDLGAPDILITGSLDEARGLRRTTGRILVGERRALRPRGFDFDNSPALLERAGVHGRAAILSTTNGTAILRTVRRSPRVLIGCLRNARACAEAAIELATEDGTGIRVVCAGLRRRFAAEDAVAAGLIVTRIAEGAGRRGAETSISDAARAAQRLFASYPTMLDALEDSSGGRTLHRIEQAEDIAYCAAVDVSDAVPILRDGTPMRIERLELPTR